MIVLENAGAIEFVQAAVAFIGLIYGGLALVEAIKDRSLMRSPDGDKRIQAIANLVTTALIIGSQACAVLAGVSGLALAPPPGELTPASVILRWTLILITGFLMLASYSDRWRRKRLAIEDDLRWSGEKRTRAEDHPHVEPTDSPEASP